MKHADIIIPLAVGGVSLVALAIAVRGGKPPSVGGPTYMKGAAGKRQFEVKRVGEGYAWTMAGEREESGSDADSGTALVTMFERLYTGNATDVVTAQVAKGSEPGMAGSFTVHKEDATQWGWLVSKPSPDQVNAIGTGEQTSRGAATLAALASIAPFTDWIVNLPSPVGSTMPEPVVPSQASFVEQRDGLLITATNVSAFDLPTWLAHAGPIIAEAMQQGAGVQEIFNALELPTGHKLNGKLPAQAVTRMRSTLDAWDKGKYLEIASVEYTLAAQAIGATIPLPGKTGRVAGHPIVVRTDGNHFDWLVWAPGNRRSDAAAVASGEEPTMNKAWLAAIAAAKQGPGIAVPPPQGQPGQGACHYKKTTSKSVNLPAATFDDRIEREIKVWSVPSGVQCSRYKLTMGVCLIPAGGGSFGALDFYTKHQTQDGPLTADVTVHLERHDGSMVDWFMFRKPIAWKRQYEVDVSYEDGKLVVHSLKRIDEPEVDACPDRERRWPGIGDDHYKVGKWREHVGEDEIVVKNWVSQPEFSYDVDGKNLVIVISYLGLPRFKSGSGAQNHILAAEDGKKTAFTLGVKIRAEGQE